MGEHTNKDLETLTPEQKEQNKLDRQAKNSRAYRGGEKDKKITAQQESLEKDNVMVDKDIETGKQPAPGYRLAV